jgi:hypothetical protein
MANESNERHKIAFDLATRIATAEEKIGGHGPAREEGARGYWVELFATCFAAGSENATTREAAVNRAKSYKKKEQ